MVVRILHCGKSLVNYGICLRERVFGFTKRGPQIGDLVYLVVKRGKETVCGMRARLADVTDAKPWPDAERYVVSFTLDEVRYCNPFDIHFLADVGGPHWSVKYLQQAKPIHEARAGELLAGAFDRHRTEAPVFLTDEAAEPDGFEKEEGPEVGRELEEGPEARLRVMGTFQTVKFKNETDGVQGLEPLVNASFYALFPAYREEHSLLIADNRLFQSAGVEARGDDFVKGIRSIPDALLVVYNRQQKHPLQVSLIEYECFGEGRVGSQEKSNYLNSHVIPQLMRFASAFSIVTDKRIRDQTIKEWVEKVITYVYSDPGRVGKFASWIKELSPGVPDQLVGRQIDKQLTEAFQTALRVILVIDELSADQKDTLGNVISAFKLETGNSIQFLSYIVRLHQKIAVTDEGAEYALSVQ